LYNSSLFAIWFLFSISVGSSSNMAPNFSFCVSYNQFSVIILSYKMFHRNSIVFSVKSLLICSN
jgi:hypothetical protein